MILFDTPRPVRFGRFRRTAHCMSDLPDAAGTRELLAFGQSIGLHPKWLQNPGEATEHFDLFDSRIDAARTAGAVEVTARDMIIRVVLPKREAAARVDASWAEASSTAKG